MFKEMTLRECTLMMAAMFTLSVYPEECHEYLGKMDT
jgi:hypothetical protein